METELKSHSFQHQTLGRYANPISKRQAAVSSEDKTPKHSLADPSGSAGTVHQHCHIFTIYLLNTHMDMAHLNVDISL